MSSNIFSFDIKSDKHFDKALNLAMCNPFTENKALELYGYEERDVDTLLFYSRLTTPEDNIILFPSPILDPTEIIVQWLKNREWSESGHYSDVVYHRGFRFSNIEFFHYAFAFAVNPCWVEYHK